MTGLIKRVGNGETTSVWSDQWISDEKPKGQDYYPFLTFNQLMVLHSGTWNGPLLDQLFDPLDAKLIRGIPLSRLTRADTYCWHFTKTGKYTV